jgi:hypothetical protein
MSLEGIEHLNYHDLMTSCHLGSHSLDVATNFLFQTIHKISKAVGFHCSYCHKTNWLHVKLESSYITNKRVD